MHRSAEEHRWTHADYNGLTSFLIYFGLSLFFYGRSLLGHWSDRYIGAGVDPGQFMWYLRWWPYAIAHRLNPFMPRVVWTPMGVNLAWAASIPLPCLLAYPLTATIGLIPTFNLLCLLSPALAGWATFLLCRLITRSYWPALFGGFIFAFSAHLIGKTFGNLNDALAFPIPLAAYVGLLRLKQKISDRRFVLSLALLLIMQFLCFIEVFATLTLVAGVTLLLAIALAADEIRKRLIAMIPLIILGYAITAIVVSPYVYFLLVHRLRQTEIMSASAYSVDLLNFVIPTPLNELGKFRGMRHLTSSFVCGLVECGGYIGVPMIAIVALFGCRFRRTPWGRLMIYLLILLLVLSLGPHLQIMGHVTMVGLPWLLVTKLPLIQKALPARFMLFAFLNLAIIAAIWLSEVDRAVIVCATLAGFTIAFMLPNLSASYWTSDANVPEFFSNRLDRRYLPPGENVVILPYGIYGDAMLWQAESDFRFNMVQGWTGFPAVPAQFEDWPMVTSMVWGANLPVASDQFKAFLANFNISTVIVVEDCACVWELERGSVGPQWWKRAAVSDNDRQLWRNWVSTLGVKPIQAGGVLLYRVPQVQLANYKPLTAIQMESADTEQRFAALVKAAAQYVEGGHDLSGLTPLHTAQLSLLPPDWVSDHYMVRDLEEQPLLNRMLLTKSDNGNDIAVGVIASAEALRPVIRQYGSEASMIQYFSTDLPTERLNQPNIEGPILLVLTFDRATLSRLAAGIVAAQSGSK
jgi:hypothetical protein